MAARDVIKNYNLFVDGRGYAGQIEDFTPPVLSTKDEEFRAGGMDAPLKLRMGMEALSAGFNLIAFDANVLALFGVTTGAATPFVARAALESFNGAVTAVVHTMRGRINKLDQGTVKSGDKAALNVEMQLSYYKLQHGARVIHEVDVENMICVVDGKDVLAAQRAAIGL